MSRTDAEALARETQHVICGKHNANASCCFYCVLQALDRARQAGALSMRNRAAAVAVQMPFSQTVDCEIAYAIRALPLTEPESER